LFAEETSAKVSNHVGNILPWPQIDADERG
jgi:hypothetical protein